MVPATAFGFEMVMVKLLHGETVCVSGVAETVGIVLTVITATIELPLQPLAVGVMV